MDNALSAVFIMITLCLPELRRQFPWRPHHSFTAICARFAKHIGEYKDGALSFSDVPETHWARDVIVNNIDFRLSRKVRTLQFSLLHITA